MFHIFFQQLNGFGDNIDLGSRFKGTWTYIDSGIWFISSQGSGVEIGSWIESKSKNWGSISFPINEMWFYKIDDSSSKFTVTGINVS